MYKFNDKVHGKLYCLPCYLKSVRDNGRGNKKYIRSLDFKEINFIEKTDSHGDMWQLKCKVCDKSSYICCNEREKCCE